MKPSAGRLDQLLPTFSFGDAVGNHAQALRAIFRGGGFRSEIFAQMRHPRVQALSRDYHDCLALDDPQNVTFFHFSIGSALSDFFRRLRSRKVLIYHNITPSEYLRGINRRAEFECRRGRRELKDFAGRVDLALADSEYNRGELKDMGFDRAEVLPIIVNFAAYDEPPSRDLLRQYDDGWKNVLHVGRFAPNKKIEDVIKGFAVYKRIHPRSRLFLVGTDVGFENYTAALRGLVERLGVDDVLFPGHVDLRELCTYYRLADLYLHMSEHEGFCVPLLEAMHFGVPIVAFRAAAVPHTLGSGGILIGEKRFDEIGELINLVLSDEGLRLGLVESGRRRLQDFAPPKIERSLWEILVRYGLVSKPGPAG